MKAKHLAIVILGALFTACVLGPEKAYQADYHPPSAREFYDEGERGFISDAIGHMDRAEAARSAGNMEQARAEWKASAEKYLSFLTQYPSTEWRIVIQRIAAEAYLKADVWDEAAKLADKMRADPQANDVTKLVGARIAAGAYYGISNKAEPLKIRTADQRRGEDPKPRPLTEGWKRFVDAADAFLAVGKTDPQAPSIAFGAALVQFAHDNLEESRARFENLLTTWPSSPDAVDSAAYYLQTFLLKKEPSDAYVAAVEKVTTVLGPEIKKAQETIKNAQATAEDKKRAEPFIKMGDQLEKEKKMSGFISGAKLMEEKMFPAAAAAFEKFAAENAESTDAPTALFNASVAWDRAGDAKKGNALRQTVVDKYADSKVAPNALVGLAQAQAKAKNHAEAAKLYDQYLAKWPDGEKKCAVLINGGVAQEELKKKEAAAKLYKQYGTDPKCAKENPNETAKILYHAGVLYFDAKKKVEAKEAFKLVVATQGVTDTVVKSQVSDAQTRIKSIK